MSVLSHGSSESHFAQFVEPMCVHKVYLEKPKKYLLFHQVTSAVEAMLRNQEVSQGQKTTQILVMEGLRI